MFDDRSCRAQRVGADAEHDGVAGADNTTGIGKDIRSAFEHETDDTKWRTSRLDRPAVMVHTVQCHIATRRGIAPDPEPVDHVRPHRLINGQAGCRTASGAGPLDIAEIGADNRREDHIVSEQVGESIEEVSDLGVTGVRQLGEPTGSSTNGSFDKLVFRRRDVQERSVGLNDHHPVAINEGRCKLIGHVGDSITTEDDRLTCCQ